MLNFLSNNNKQLINQNQTKYRFLQLSNLTKQVQQINYISLVSLPKFNDY